MQLYSASPGLAWRSDFVEPALLSIYSELVQKCPGWMRGLTVIWFGLVLACLLPMPSALWWWWCWWDSWQLNLSFVFFRAWGRWTCYKLEFRGHWPTGQSTLSAVEPHRRRLSSWFRAAGVLGHHGSGQHVATCPCWQHERRSNAVGISCALDFVLR